MKTIDQSLLTKLIQLAGNNLKGDWVLMGGTVLPLLGINYRVTTDIDLAGTSSKQQEQTLDLMTLAEKVGLPVETINQAGAYFLQKISNFSAHLLLIHRGKTAKIFRPDLYLFIALKIDRLSESDLSDCLEYIKYSKQASEEMFKEKIIKMIASKIKVAKSEDQRARLNQLGLFLKTIAQSS